MTLSQTYPDAKPSLLLDFANSNNFDPATYGFARTSTATYVDDRGFISIAQSGEPRFGYNPVTKEPLGLHIERAATNINQYSNDFSFWNLGTNTITTNYSQSPDGTNNATLLRENNQLSRQNIGINVGTAEANKKYVRSVFAKYNGNDRHLFLETDGYGSWVNSGSAYFDLVNGVVLSPTPTLDSYGIQDYGNGWYRCWIACTKDEVTETVTIELEPFLYDGTPSNPSSSLTRQGDPNEGIIVWGSQFEEGIYPTSYIPTSGSNVTRSSDFMTTDGATFQNFFNENEGSFVCEFNLPWPNREPFNETSILNFMEDDNTTDQIRLYRISSNQIRIRYRKDAVDIGFLTSTSQYTTTDSLKVAFSYSKGSQILAINGEETISLSLDEIPTPLAIHFGNFSSGNPLTSIEGYVKKLAYYPKSFDEEKIFSLTT